MRVTITIHHDLAEDVYTLEATSYLRTEPAGPRLFRAQPWPDIQFQHIDPEAAERDRSLLQRYLDTLGKQRKGKRGAEEGDAIETVSADLSQAWWMQ